MHLESFARGRTLCRGHVGSPARAQRIRGCSHSELVPGDDPRYGAVGGPLIAFYRDALDDSLYRVAADGVPDILLPSGEWRAYPSVDLQAGAMPITEEAARHLAGDADLAAPRADGE